jgi:hypothetical protein
MASNEPDPVEDLFSFLAMDFLIRVDAGVHIVGRRKLGLIRPLLRRSGHLDSFRSRSRSILSLRGIDRYSCLPRFEVRELLDECGNDFPVVPNDAEPSLLEDGGLGIRIDS